MGGTYRMRGADEHYLNIFDQKTRPVQANTSCTPRQVLLGRKKSSGMTLT
jgi:hypothetical protein